MTFLKSDIKTKGSIKRLTSFFLAAIFLALSILTMNVRQNNASPDVSQALSQFGSSGEEVRQIQKKLKSLGYYTGTVDGIFGSQTRTAVKAFQRACGLTVDGIAGPKTLLYLGITSNSSYNSSDVYLLAKLIEAEARGENYTGQVAVGAVVLNRVSHSSFPDTVAGVIYQAGAFSCVTDSNWSVSPSATSQKAARDAMNGWDPSGGAIYYYNPRTAKSAWIRSRPVICTIGNHVFCS
ncbi:MAG: spore cortex-lytic enzyme [Oscillospiraceae bacterium]|nr:spore cortex-lytic enzyme [Oscillospiraceae bacterium]